MSECDFCSVSIHTHTHTKGTLDQGLGVLVLYDDTSVDKTYKASLQTISGIGTVVDALYAKAKALN